MTVIILTLKLSHLVATRKDFLSKIVPGKAAKNKLKTYEGISVKPQLKYLTEISCVRYH